MSASDTDLSCCEKHSQLQPLQDFITQLSCLQILFSEVIDFLHPSFLPPLHLFPRFCRAHVEHVAQVVVLSPM